MNDFNMTPVTTNGPIVSKMLVTLVQKQRLGTGDNSSCIAWFTSSNGAVKKSTVSGQTIYESKSTSQFYMNSVSAQ